MALCKPPAMNENEIRKHWIMNCRPCLSNGGRVAQRITRLTTNQKIAGSNPAVLEINLFEDIQPFLTFRKYSRMKNL